MSAGIERKFDTISHKAPMEGNSSILNEKLSNLSGTYGREVEEEIVFISHRITNLQCGDFLKDTLLQTGQVSVKFPDSEK